MLLAELILTAPIYSDNRLYLKCLSLHHFTLEKQYQFRISHP